jgi:hypothetical protein
MTVRSLYAFQVILIVLMPIDASQCEMRLLKVHPTIGGYAPSRLVNSA